MTCGKHRVQMEIVKRKDAGYMCDVCDCSLKGKDAYHCGKCSQGGMDICQQCVDNQSTYVWFLYSLV